MKSTITNSVKYLPLVLGGMGLFAHTANGAVSLENGGLAVAFYQYTGSAVAANTLIYDLGSASIFRENALAASVSTINPGIASANLGTQLTNAFGSNWADAGTVRWMLIGSVSGAASPINGDPNRTIYLSNLNADITNQTLRGQVSGDIFSFTGGNQNETATANADAAQILASDSFSIDNFMPPTITNGLYFKQNQDITQTLGAGTISGGFEGSLDVYRIINTATGADLTAGLSGGDAAAGERQYIGTFTLDTAGNIGVIPEPSAALLGVVGALGLVLRRRRNA